MGSATRFWPSRLFGRAGKDQPAQGFVPTTEIAARIVGKPLAASAMRRDDLEADPAVASNDALHLDDADESGADAESARQAERFVPDRPFTTLTDKRGKVIRARIINLSASGVAIEADYRVMPPDTVTMAGSKTVTSGRAIRGGHVFVFDKPLDAGRSNTQVIL